MLHLAEHFPVYTPSHFYDVLWLCRKPGVTSAASDRVFSTNSPRSSSLCRQRSGRVSRSRPCASSADTPRPPGPTVTRCSASSPRCPVKLLKRPTSLRLDTLQTQRLPRRQQSTGPPVGAAEVIWALLDVPLFGYYKCPDAQYTHTWQVYQGAT